MALNGGRKLLCHWLGKSSTLGRVERQMFAALLVTGVMRTVLAGDIFVRTTVLWPKIL